MADWQEDDDALEGIAIIGMAGRFPKARDLEAYWRNLREGVDCISHFSEEELLEAGVGREMLADPKFVAARGVLDDVELFDASFFDLSPREAEIIDPQQRLFLEYAWTALERAGYDPGRVPGPVGVFGGTTISSYQTQNLYTRPDLLRALGGYQLGLGNDKDYVATRVSYKLNLRGPSIDVQSACSTSLVATVMACQALINYQCDLALAGGASVRVPQVSGYFYSEGGLDSSDGYCRAFDAKADGSVYGSGVGVLVLKRLEDALEDGDEIEAVILGSAINNDGSTKVGFTAPSVEGQAQVIATAQALAGVDSSEIDYVETHGTGTELGDPIEVAALQRAFKAGAGSELAPGSCAIGSVKTNIGHLSAASGVAALIKTTLALGHGEIPPSLHFEEPNPKCDFAKTAFAVNAELRPWPENERPRRAGVSSFGLGGTNAHVVLEEAPEPEPSGPSRSHQLLVFSARSEAALEAMTDRLAADLAAHPDRPLADVAHTLQVGRKVFDHRRMLVCRDGEDGQGALEERDPRRVLGLHQKPERRPLAFLFSGLGDHYVGMARDLYREEPTFREHLDRAAEIVEPEIGEDLRRILYPEGTEARSAEAGVDLKKMLGRGGGEGAEADEASQRLDRTRVLQPALFAVEMALAQLLLEWGLRPEAVIGYSLGEYAAACLAGVIGFDDALRLVAWRARLIESQPEGAMLAVPLSRERLEEELRGELDLAAVNGPELSVVAGPAKTVEALEERLDVPCRRLAANHAFHSRMMVPVARELEELVAKIELRPPEIPLLSNVTGRWLTAEEATDPGYWSRHLCGTVEFSRGLETLWQNPSRLLIEIGPGQGLTSLALQHPGGAEGPRTALPTLRGRFESEDDQAFLLRALGRLWLAGAEIDWAGFHRREKRRRVPLPTYPFEYKRYWVEPGARAFAAGGLSASPAGAGLHLPVWRPSPPRKSERLEAAENGLWWVLAAPDGFGAALGDGLAERGHRVVRIERGVAWERLGEETFRVRPGSAEDVARVLEEVGEPPRAILHAWGLSGEEEPALELAELGPSGWVGLEALGQALGKAAEAMEVRLLTRGTHAVSGEESLNVASAALLGAFEVVSSAFPERPWEALDLDLPAGEGRRRQRLRDTLLDEFERPAQRGSFAVRGGRRWERGFEPAPGVAGMERWRQGGVYAVAAWHPALPLELVRNLAERGGARLLLAGPAAATVAGLVGGSAAEIAVSAADLSAEGGWSEVLAEAEKRFGALHGVVETAATLGAEPLEDLEGRLAGLGRALAGRRLDFVFVITDPNVGEEAALDPLASAAKAALVATVAHREGLAGSTPWTAVTRHGEAGALPAVEALGQLLSLEPLAHAVLAGEDGGEGEANAERGARGSRHERPELPSAYRAPESELEKGLTAMWEEILGIEGIGADDSFFELGGHSLQGTVLLSRVRDGYRVELPLRMLFEGPTVAEMAAAVMEGQVERAGRGEVDDLLDQLEDLDDEAAAQLLEEMS